eukprot:6458488-Amphidinium_carterae.1
MSVIADIARIPPSGTIPVKRFSNTLNQDTSVIVLMAVPDNVPVKKFQLRSYSVTAGSVVKPPSGKLPVKRLSLM